ncbi:hypothetical protein PGT21_023909 [Puccinia graminis f. sp. tritici]|uniref:Uncharacterized protein n=1 Tax=Puccinia graminis f. sp. tritici TaxID=56615 RepID=A0A5B0S4L2_PUCGR|nr:hypothetical protein PGT21_023909 [Puccinia graminis f. sp. tritici]KAA1132767.1 hypothetical protein PGTUg99_009041 [Puccinia graminis f. sp. tritici]
MTEAMYALAVRGFATDVRTVSSERHVCHPHSDRHPSVKSQLLKLNQDSFLLRFGCRSLLNAARGGRIEQKVASKFAQPTSL